MLHDWLNQPGYASLFFMSLLASTLLPLGSEWLLVMMLAGGYDPLSSVAVATAGNYLGAVVTYLIGIWGGSWLVEKVLRVSTPQQERARNYYKRFGAYSLLFSWWSVIRSAWWRGCSESISVSFRCWSSPESLPAM